MMEKGMELDNGKYLSQGWDMIKGNVQKINDLVLDLLSFSRPRRNLHLPIASSDQRYRFLRMGRSRNCL